MFDLLQLKYLESIYSEKSKLVENKHILIIWSRTIAFFLNNLYFGIKGLGPSTQTAMIQSCIQ